MALWSEYLKPDVIARLSAVGLFSNRVVDGTISGLHKSPLQGLSPEFTDYREYTFGDDLKNLDWRAYARSDRFYIKRFEEESNLRAWIILDASASMNYGRSGIRKFDYAATLAASLAALLIRQRDAVGLTMATAEGRSELRPSAVRSQLAKIIDVLESVEVAGKTDLGGVLSETADRMKRRGMVLIISDLFTPQASLYEALGRLQYSGHEILLFHVLDRDEIEMPFEDSVMFRDIEGDEEIFANPRAFRRAYQSAIAEFLGEIENRCLFCGIDYFRLMTEDDPGETLAQRFHERTLRGPARHVGRMSGKS
jgi:uncharacterized protein (DUF58 family)